MRLKSLRAAALSALLASTALAGASVSPAQARGAPDSFADLAAQLSPAVVNVSSTQKAEARADRGAEVPGFPPGSPFEQFFRDFMDRNHPGGQGQGPQRRGENNRPSPRGGDDAPSGRATSLGSGFIIDPAGYIVTNNHVIDGADEISVTLTDNTTLKAKLIGKDDRVDLALLKVETTHPLTAVKFGDSDVERVGDWVLAIGNPFGLGGSVTAGIVSARGRDIRQGPYDDFIQTDAAINRGNSGGPLFNMAGEVIGINTAIYSPSGGSVGIGFSVPSNLAKNVVMQLKEYGHARRGWLGVRIQQVTPDIAEAVGLKDARGAMVAGMNDGGPADKAGIHNGDVILKFNGQDVKEMRTLPAHCRRDRDREVGTGPALARPQGGHRPSLHRRASGRRSAGQHRRQAGRQAALGHHHALRPRCPARAYHRPSARQIQAVPGPDRRRDHRCTVRRSRCRPRPQARRRHCRGPAGAPSPPRRTFRTSSRNTASRAARPS